MPGPVDNVTAALKARGSKTDGTCWQCPAHEDGRPSLKVDAATGPDGERVLVYCHAGCSPEAVVEALGLSMRDLFDNAHATPGPIAGEPVSYVYTDENGEPLFRVTRRAKDGGKTFTQARYAPEDPTADAEGYISRRGCMTGMERVLYRLPQVVAAVREGRTVYLVEGEKDADALAARGEAATCNPQGAGKWKQVRDHARGVLSGAAVVVVQDKDEPGRAHAREVVDSLQDVAASVRLVEARQGNDTADHLGAGLDVVDLVEIAGPDVEPSRMAWELVDPFAEPGEPPPPPDLLRGSDGTALVYRGQRVLFSGEPGHGKTWAALCLTAQVLGEGGKVAWIDTDAMGPPALVERLGLLGVSPADGARLLRYSLAREDLSREDLRAMAALLVADGFALVVMDSWEPALVLSGVDSNDNAQVNRWHNDFTDTLHAGGVTLALLDHVPKSKERNRRYSIGAAAKLRPIEIHLFLKPAKGEELTRGTDGAFLLTCEKDRLGHVPEGSVYRLELAQRGGVMEWDVTGGRDGDKGDFAPTTIMEKVSRLLEVEGEKSGSQVRKTPSMGKDEYVRQALSVLVLGGWVTATPGPRNATLYRSAMPFRDGDDLPDGFHS